ncbi:hypothetical protein EVAR_38567_1 [Eumeta japonica]|uniref:Uncharacterized protein n=1 Tax=Eumeta variegata TaxID=151549 RepID=A0A4C1WTW3_EUMVA|nr:hypothetical protein EVAR_38567_1 [Eumeta japonica]
MAETGTIKPPPNARRFQRLQETKVIIAVHGHSQTQNNYQCVVDRLGRNRISDEEENELMEEQYGDGGGKWL